jgi:hypothetical protein
MNTLDDLRRSLDGRATRTTSDGHGLVQAAQEGAARIRRRRRIAGAAGAACLVVVAAAVVPVVVARQHADHPPVVATPAPYRKPGQVTLGIAGSKYFLIFKTTDRNVQQLSLRNRDTSVIRDYGGEVIAYDPGTYDPAQLRRGERTTVSGHDAWLMMDYRFPDESQGMPVLGWQDPSGVWVLAFRLDRTFDRTSVFAFASVVRVGPAQPLTAPIQLPAEPAGLPLTAVLLQGGPHGFSDATVAFGAGGKPQQIPFPGLPRNVPLQINSTPQGNLDMPMIKAALTKIPPIAGHPAWYGVDGGAAGGWEGGGRVLIDAEGCTVQFISANLGTVSRAQLEATAATATYADCTDPSTWTPPLG